MDTTTTRSKHASGTKRPLKVDLRLEVFILPVTDVERAKRFYMNMGWRLDADFAAGDIWRGVQITPPGSACSFIFGKGVTNATPGSAQGLLLVVDDIHAARAELLGHGVEVSEAFHFDGPLHFTGVHGRAPGPDPEGRPYFTFAEFKDPDGNGWLLQEVKVRLPGRGFSSMDVATLTPLLREAEQHHHGYEKNASKHHWSEWYAAYLVARQNGKAPDEAARDAALHMKKA